jgi:hypothetical protein
MELFYWGSLGFIRNKFFNYDQQTLITNGKISIGLGGILYNDHFFTYIHVKDMNSEFPHFSLGIGKEFTLKNVNFSFTPSINLVHKYSRLKLESNIAMRYKKLRFGLAYSNNIFNSSMGYD